MVSVGAGDEQSAVELEHVVANTSVESVVDGIKLLALTAYMLKPQAILRSTVRTGE